MRERERKNQNLGKKAMKDEWFELLNLNTKKKDMSGELKEKKETKYP